MNLPIELILQIINSYDGIYDKIIMMIKLSMTCSSMREVFKQQIKGINFIHKFINHFSVINKKCYRKCEDIKDGMCIGHLPIVRRPKHIPILNSKSKCERYFNNKLVSYINNAIYYVNENYNYKFDYEFNIILPDITNRNLPGQYFECNYKDNKYKYSYGFNCELIYNTIIFGKNITKVTLKYNDVVLHKQHFLKSNIVNYIPFKSGFPSDYKTLYDNDLYIEIQSDSIEKVYYVGYFIDCWKKFRENTLFFGNNYRVNGIYYKI